MPKPEASVVVLVQAHKIQRAALCYGTNKRVSLSFLWVKIMTVQEQKLCHWRKVSWLESKFALGRRVTPKAFKQIFHSQKPIQVNKCFKEHSRDPEALPDLLRAQIPRLVHTDLYTCVYVGTETEKLLKNEDRTEKINGIIEVPWRLLRTLKLHIFLDRSKHFAESCPRDGPSSRLLG